MSYSPRIFSHKELRDQHNEHHVIGDLYKTHLNDEQTPYRHQPLSKDFVDAGSNASLFTETTQNPWDNRIEGRPLLLHFQIIMVKGSTLLKYFLDDDLLHHRITTMAREEGSTDKYDALKPGRQLELYRQIRENPNMEFPVLIIKDNAKGIQGPVVLHNEYDISALATMLLSVGQGEQNNLGKGGAKGKGSSTLFEASEINTFIAVSQRAPQPGGGNLDDVSRIAFGSRFDGAITVTGSADKNGNCDKLHLHPRSLWIKERILTGPQLHHGYIPFTNDDAEIDNLMADFGIDIPDTGTAFIVPCVHHDIIDGFEQLIRVPTLRFGIPIQRGELEILGECSGEAFHITKENLEEEYKQIDFTNPKLVGKKTLRRGRNVLNNQTSEHIDAMNSLRLTMATRKGVYALPKLFIDTADGTLSDEDGIVVTNTGGASKHWSSSVIEDAKKAVESGKTLGLNVSLAWESLGKKKEGQLGMFAFRPSGGLEEGVKLMHRAWMLIPAAGKNDANVSPWVAGVNIPFNLGSAGGKNPLHDLARASESEGHHNFFNADFGNRGLKGKIYESGDQVLGAIHSITDTVYELLYPPAKQDKIWKSPLVKLTVAKKGDGDGVCPDCNNSPCRCAMVCPECGEVRPCDCPSDHIGVNQLSGGNIRLTPGRAKLQKGDLLIVWHAYAVKGSKSDLKKYNPDKDGLPSSVSIIDDSNVKLTEEPCHDTEKGGVRLRLEVLKEDWSATVDGLEVDVNGFQAGLRGDFVVDYEIVRSKEVDE